MKNYLSKGKTGLIKWMSKLEDTELLKLCMGLAMSIAYGLSTAFPSIGQWLLCGLTILIGFISFASLLLSRAGVSIKKLEPIEDAFSKLDASLFKKDEENVR